MASLALQEAIDELVASISIIESANVMESTRGGVSAKLVCGCTFSERNPLRQTSKKNCPTLLACVQSLRELIEKKHAHCIAAKLAEDEAADAAAARKQNLGLLSVITDGARKAERAERHAAELLAAKELHRQKKREAVAAEGDAEDARGVELDCATLRDAAEAKAAEAAAAAAAAHDALAELQGGEKRARTEAGDAGAEYSADPEEPPSQWSLCTWRTQEAWAAVRRTVAIRADAAQRPMKKGKTDGYSGSPSPCVDRRSLEDKSSNKQHCAKNRACGAAGELSAEKIKEIFFHFAPNRATP